MNLGSDEFGTLHCRAGQIEIMLNFFIGYYHNGCYIHSVPEIAKRSEFTPVDLVFYGINMPGLAKCKSVCCGSAESND